jgi:hypothetical protein
LSLQGQARVVDMAATTSEPEPLAVLPGKRVMLTAQTSQDAAGWGETPVRPDRPTAGPFKQELRNALGSSSTQPLAMMFA